MKKKSPDLRLLLVSESDVSQEASDLKLALLGDSLQEVPFPTSIYCMSTDGATLARVTSTGHRSMITERKWSSMSPEERARESDFDFCSVLSSPLESKAKYCQTEGYVPHLRLSAQYPLLASLNSPSSVEKLKMLDELKAIGLLDSGAVSAPSSSPAFSAKLETKELCLRRAEWSDRETLFDIRNDEESRRQSGSQGVVAWSTHIAWFARTLPKRDRSLWCLDVDQTTVGTVRWDTQGGAATISVALHPSFRGQGYGKRLVSLGEEALRSVHPETCLLRAMIRRANESSRRLFVSAGYQCKDDSSDEMLTFTKTPTERNGE